MDQILFIRLRLLGDIVFTIPSIQIFKERFPQTRIFYLVEEAYLEIAGLIPGIHEVITVPRDMGIKKMWQFYKEIRKMNFETVVDFHSGPKSAQLTWLTRAKTRIGYRTPNRNWAYTHLTPRRFGDLPTHSVFNQAKLLEHLGIQINEENLPEYPVIEPDETKIRDFVHSALQNEEKKAVIHVGAGNAFRDWGIENFSDLIDRLKKEKWNVYIIGNSKEETEKGQLLEARHGNFNFTGRLSISETLHLVSRSNIYIGADSGPLHVASLTATPIVALYGPNIPEISGPWRKTGVSIIRHRMDCQPCSQRKCIYGIIPCMKNISTDEIYETIIRHYR